MDAVAKIQFIPESTFLTHLANSIRHTFLCKLLQDYPEK